MGGVAWGFRGGDLRVVWWEVVLKKQLSRDENPWLFAVYIGDSTT